MLSIVRAAHAYIIPAYDYRILRGTQIFTDVTSIVVYVKHAKSFSDVFAGGQIGPPKSAKSLRLRGECRNNTVMGCPDCWHKDINIKEK